MLPFLGDTFGNPSSIHAVGRAARAFLDEARERLAFLWQAKPSEVVFTSGGTESNSLAIIGAALANRERGRHVVTASIEHSAVLGAARWLEKHAGFSSSIVRTDSYGRVAPDDVLAAVRNDTVLVSVMAANNEIGTLEPVAEIGQACRARGVLFHTDAVQWFGKEPVTAITDFDADLVSGCAHKLYGPKGAGVLYVRSPLRLAPMLLGGSQEDERRAGTENLAAIAGLVAAWEAFGAEPALKRTKVEPLLVRLEASCLRVDGVRIWGPGPSGRLANTLAVTAAGCDSLSLLAGLDLEGVCASSGSACSVGSLKPSHVLASMGASPEEASGLVRFSLGRDTTLAQIEATGSAFQHVVQRVRNCGLPVSRP